MRISKEPEVRKQEIIEVAMKVFAQKGYEATTMKDIAREANVVAGLCYHYFQNKQELYQTAVSQYAQECSQAFIQIFQQTDKSLDECIDLLAQIAQDQDKMYKYKEFFHKSGNEWFHKELEFHMSKAIFPYMERYLEELAERGEIACEEKHLFACFLWNGQMAVMNEESIPLNERTAFVRKMLHKVME